MTMRAGAAVLGGVLAVGVLAGCGGGDDGDGTDEDEPTAETSSTEATSAEPTAGLPAGADGRHPHRAGRRPRLRRWRPRSRGARARTPWWRSTSTVERIDETSYKESFEGWVVTQGDEGADAVLRPRDGDQRRRGPRSAACWCRSTRCRAARASTSRWTSARSRSSPAPAATCRSGWRPASRRTCASSTCCLPFERLTAAAFDPVGELAPVTWTGEITEIEKPDKDKKGDKKGDKDDKKKDKKGR